MIAPKGVVRPLKEYDSLKTKFDKQANTKKPTGSSDCPDGVLRAKKSLAKYL